jgi:hypothetical protein
MTEEESRWAIRRIRAKRGFWIHLSVHVAVKALLMVIWAATSTTHFRPIWAKARPEFDPEME